MLKHLSGILSGRVPTRRLVCAMFLLLATALTLAGNTPGTLTDGSPKGACYCHCSASHGRMGCVKMCELKKYATRWWATTCAKPRIKPPADDSGAGPRLPHPDHAEHAQL